MDSFDISQHAALRWIERVDSRCTVAEARAEIRTHSRAIEAALKIGCRSIRLGNGVRIVLAPADAEVVTILPAQPKVVGVQHSGRALDFRASRAFALKERNNAMD